MRRHRLRRRYGRSRTLREKIAAMPPHQRVPLERVFYGMHTPEIINEEARRRGNEARLAAMRAKRRGS